MLRTEDQSIDPLEELSEKAEALGLLEFSTFFEHGQWWLEGMDAEESRHFSVVDCQSVSGEDYLDLEEL